MATFTELLNKGIRKYLDKYEKSRQYGPCYNCSKFDLLIKFEDPLAENSIWELCEYCYIDLMNEEGK